VFNPLYQFTTEVLEATIKKGCDYFVRNTYRQPQYNSHEEIKGYYIITHYNDKAKSEAHYNSIAEDKNRYLYNCYNKEDKEKLKIAASQPKGYMIYSAYFMPNYREKISKRTKDRINTYIFKHTNWKPTKGYVVGVDFYLQFGSIFIALNYAGQEIKINFDEIENQK